MMVIATGNLFIMPKKPAAVIESYIYIDGCFIEM